MLTVSEFDEITELIQSFMGFGCIVSSEPRAEVTSQLLVVQLLDAHIAKAPVHAAVGTSIAYMMFSETIQVVYNPNCKNLGHSREINTLPDSLCLSLCT